MLGISKEKALSRAWLQGGVDHEASARAVHALLRSAAPARDPQGDDLSVFTCYEMRFCQAFPRKCLSFRLIILIDAMGPLSLAADGARGITHHFGSEEFIILLPAQRIS